MALDIDKTKMGSRSSRFGSRSRSSFKSRGSSRGVLSLNQGSSPHSGGKTTMKPGRGGGGFGAGRPAGGGAGGQQGAIAAALLGEAPGAPLPEVGPPPADFANLPPAQDFRTTPVSLPPSLLPAGRDQALAPQVPGLFPRSEPTPVDPNLVWMLSQRLAF